MPLFQKKPIVIEAIQFTGRNQSDVLGFVYPGLSSDSREMAQIASLPVVIETLEGDMTASPGDWIIKGVNGEFYPCNPEVFEKSYDSVEMISTT